MVSVFSKPALSFLRRTLQGEDLIKEPLHANCRACVVVPIMREPIKRALSLFESLADQIGLEDGSFEVLAIVNRSTDDGSEDATGAEIANQAILDLPLWRNRETGAAAHRFPEEIVRLCRGLREKVRAYAVDKTSAGREIPGGNIARARNRGLAEAALRFSRADSDGLLIFTDVDSRFTDTRHIAKALALFDADHDMVAASGGVDFVFDPDVEDPQTRELLCGAFRKLLLSRKWQHLERLARGKGARLVPSGAFFGSHMLVRSSVAAEIGGNRERAEHDDFILGLRLKQYAACQDKRVGDVSRCLRVQTALRESGRGLSSSIFGREVTAKIGQLPMLVEDPFSPGEQRVLDEEFYENVRRKLETDTVAIRKIRALDDVGAAIFWDVFPHEV